MFAAMAAVGTSILRFSGALSTTSGSSPVTSATRTISGYGTLEFSSVESDGGTPGYSLNGGAWTTITEGMTLAVVNADTLAVRAALSTVGFTASFTLKKLNGGIIEGVTLERT